jgi:methionyl-tRNA synthetase
MKKKFYITTAIPYVNAKPHVGHALEFVQADCIAKYHRLLGENVALLSGGDENALKNVQAAEIAGKQIQPFVDENSELFRILAKKLDVQFDFFQKGSDTKNHYPASQKLWNLCRANDDIYEKEYSGLYCLGCEVFYTPEELNEHGECFEHPGKKLETVAEKNYFFRLSKYQKQLIDLIRSDMLKIFPEFRKNEVLSFLKQPLQDISISRSNQRAKNWGVPVPDDDTQRMYVWFDALNIYQSGVGFGWNDTEYKKWWPADVHVIGKGISRFHAIYWPAFLLSAHLPLPKTLFIHGYFTVNGQKMSKTLGNVIDPILLIEKYGADALRYYFLAKFSPFGDGDFSEKEFVTTYNADLANGVGNFAARIAKLCEQSHITVPTYKSNYASMITKYGPIKKQMDDFKFDEYIKSIRAIITTWDHSLEEKKPWRYKNEIEKNLPGYLPSLVEIIRETAALLLPVIPNAAQSILDQFSGPNVMSQPPLFPRIK